MKLRLLRDMILLYIGYSGIDVSKVDCLVYFFQKFGFSMKYKFQISTCGVYSKGLHTIIDELISTGDIVIVDKKYRCSTRGDMRLDKMCVDYAEYEIMEYLCTEVSKLSKDDLDMLTIIDMIFNDIKTERGIQALVDERDTIEKMVGNVCKTYSPSRFNNLSGFLSKLERRFK